MKVLNIRYIMLLLALSGIFFGCEDDVAATSSTEVELLSFGPSGLKHGENVKFVGRNLDKVTAITLGGAAIPQSAFISQSSDSIWVKIPNEALRGKAVLATPGGNIESLSMIDFEVPVTISSVPLTAKPGDNISIKGNFVNWITAIKFEKDTTVTQFVRSSLNELVVKVPVTAQSGKLTFFTGGTEPLEILSDTTLFLTLPTITGFSPNPIDRGQNITITGTNLDLVKAVLFKGAAPYYLDSAVSKSATQIVVKVPPAAGKGTLGLLTFSNSTIESAGVLTLSGDPAPPPLLSVIFYDDVLKNGWQKWGGWGAGAGGTVLNSTDKVREGTTSIKVNFAGDWGGALQLGAGNISTTGKSNLAFSIYAMPGTNGKKINVTAKGGSTENAEIVLKEGEWTDYQIPLSQFGNPSTITEFILQDQAVTGTIYIDYIGLR